MLFGFKNFLYTTASSAWSSLAQDIKEKASLSSSKANAETHTDTLVQPLVSKAASVVRGIFSHINKHKLAYTVGLAAAGSAMYVAAPYMNGIYVVYCNKQNCLGSNDGHLFDTLGSSALEFEPSSSKAKVLFLSSVHDHNGAFSTELLGNFNMIKTLNQVADLKYKVIDKAQDVCREIAASDTPIDALIIGAHGNPRYIDLKHKYGEMLSSWDLEEIWNSTCFKNLKQNTVISLVSCSAGKGKDSFAEKLANVSKRVVVGYEEDAAPTWGGFVFSIPGKIKFGIGVDKIGKTQGLSSYFTSKIAYSIQKRWFNTGNLFPSLTRIFYPMSGVSVSFNDPLISKEIKVIGSASGY